MRSFFKGYEFRVVPGRRKALQAMAVTTAALLAACAPGREGPDVLLNPYVYKETALLSDLGLQDFATFYETGRQVYETYRVRLPFFTDIQDTLEKVASGEIADKYDQRVMDLRDGWGEKGYATSVDAAKAQVRDANINGIYYGDSIDDYRNWLYEKTLNTPLLILALPQNIMILPDQSAEQELNQPVDQIIGMPSLQRADKDSLLIKKAHQAIQSNWLKIKTYADRGSFTNYLDTLSTNALSLAEQFALNPAGVSQDFVNSSAWEQLSVDGVPNTIDNQDALRLLKEDVIFKLNFFGQQAGIDLTVQDSVNPRLSLQNFAATLMRKFKFELTTSESKNQFYQNYGPILEAILQKEVFSMIFVEGKGFGLKINGFFQALNQYLINPSPTAENTTTDDTVAKNNVQQAFLQAFTN